MKVGRQDDGSVEGGTDAAKVSSVSQEEADETLCWATETVTASAMGDGVAFSEVFLNSEVEAGGGGGLKFCCRSCGDVEASMLEVEPNIVKGEGGFFVGGTGVLARSKEVEEGDADDVSCGGLKRGVRPR